MVTKDLPISPRFTPYTFLSRCMFSALTTRRPMVEIYLLTFPRFPLRKKEHKSYFGKNRTTDSRTSRCAGYLLDHYYEIVSHGCGDRYIFTSSSLFFGNRCQSKEVPRDLKGEKMSCYIAIPGYAIHTYYWVAGRPGSSVGNLATF